MKLSDLYAGTASPATQAPSQPLSPVDNSGAPPAKAPNAQAVSMSWIGAVLALVLLRVIYEVSE